MRKSIIVSLIVGAVATTVTVGMLALYPQTVKVEGSVSGSKLTVTIWGEGEVNHYLVRDGVAKIGRGVLNRKKGILAVHDGESMLWEGVLAGEQATEVKVSMKRKRPISKDVLDVFQKGTTHE